MPIGLGECVDVHPRRARIAKVMLLWPHAPTPATWDMQIIFIRERKLVSGGRAPFHQAGVAGDLGLSAGYPGGRVGNGIPPKGGHPCLLGATIEVAKLPKLREREDLWHSLRSLHARMAMGDGSIVLHAMSLYNVNGDCGGVSMLRARRALLSRCVFPEWPTLFPLLKLPIHRENPLAANTVAWSG